MDTVRDHYLNDQPLLRVNTWRATFDFIKLLKILELTQAIGKFNDVMTALTEGLHNEQSAFSVEEIVYSLDQLQCKLILVFY